MVSIQKNQVHVCGGTLVSEDAVLSDADCLPSSMNVGVERGAGRLHQNASNPQEVRVMITNVTRSNTGGVSNVVVLKLASKPTLSNYIQPICLDDGQNTFAEGTMCYSAGWSLAATGAQTLREIQTLIVSCGNTSSANTLCTGTFTVTQFLSPASPITSSGPALTAGPALLASHLLLALLGLLLFT
ncbi:hypothetical protein WMY93_001870 [Mugilogobius chulae]|uniref:Peptidase S1 domain-containing protein n=1 Tax=Mugilogobius chulae TaxID=88201 RepID=A0AAW0PUN8_9GOBI